jgi:potassium efflux system protein
MKSRVTYLLPALVLAACLGLLSVRLAAQDSLAGEFSKRPEIEKRLAAVRSEISGLPADADAALRERLLQLEALCQFHLAATDVAAKAQAERESAVQAATAWRGFPQPPPYSILLLDEVRETLATLANSQRAGEAQLRIFAAEIEAARDKLQGFQQAERKSMEAAATGAAPDDRLTAERSVKIERVSSRIAAEEIARATLRHEAQQAELSLIRSKSELAGRQLKALEGKTAFPQSDFDTIQQRLNAERAEAVNALMAASQNHQPPNPLLAWRIEYLDLEKSFWAIRFSSFAKKDAGTRKAALDSLSEFKSRVDDWTEIAQLRLAGGSIGASEIDPVRLREGLLQASQLQRRIGFAIADLEGGHLQTPALDRIISAVRSLFDAELYLAEETDIVDGQKISTYRAVTPAKLARLALILTVGWLFLRFVSKRVRRVVAAKANIPPATAELAAKCAFAIGLALLVVYGLNTVRIPFTVFAFLGGALAIGVGFGTQTLLKNFISGIILIFERPFKVGDSVEIEGVTGNIRSIGMRASIIKHGNGIDTLIPNSNLLENKVTNWNLTDSLLRHSIVVGVDYATPTREVSRALLSVADEHGLVLKDPAPEVRFEDFGEKALVFRLLFWFDATKTYRDTLASDLRFMIDKAFQEAGILIASPQSEIQFDPRSVLRVELASTSTLSVDKIDPSNQSKTISP